MINNHINKDDIVLITGAHGLLGKELYNQLKNMGIKNILTPTHQDLDYRNFSATLSFLKKTRPKFIFHLASVVFGLLGNMTHQIQSIADNTLINHNVIMASFEVGIKKIFFAGTVASYPFPYKNLPLTEDMLWDGSPHQGEYGYAHAKRHALAYLEILRQNQDIDFFYGILTNIYGPNDKFDEINGHVIPSLIRKLYVSKRKDEPFHVWGDGSAMRDFIYVKDAASAIIMGMNKISGCANICSGKTLKISSVVQSLVNASGYKKEVIWEKNKPVGIPERSVSLKKLESIGFRPIYDIDTGLKETWDWFEKNISSVRL